MSIDDAAVLGRRLLELGPGTVLLKLGANGALAVALGEHVDMADAVAFANLAASISATRLGAQASIPARAEVDALRR